MKRTVSFLLAVICIILTAGFTSATVTAAATEINIDILHSDMWQGDSVKISNRYVNGGKVISVSPDEGSNEFRFSSEFDATALVGCCELVLSISVRGSSDRYDIGVVLGAGSYRSDMFVKSVECKGIQKIYVPISPDLAASLDYIEISVQGTELPIYTMLLGITADDRFTYAAIENFGSEDIDIKKGTWAADADGFSVAPDSDGNARASMSFISDTSNDGAYIVWINTVSSTAGNISVAAELKEEEVPVSQEQIMAVGSHSNVFVVEGAFSKVTFDIGGLSGKDSEKVIRITGGGVLHAGKGFDMGDTLGTVTSCRYENGRVAVSGTLGGEASLKYVNSKLGLYVIPLWEGTKGLLDKEPDVISGFSTLFTMYVTPDENYMSCLYLPVIVADGENIPICKPVMAYSAGQSTGNIQNTAAVYAIDGAAPSGAFEANAGAEIIDIYVDRLLDSQDVYSASLYSYRGTPYYFNSEYVGDMARRINFASAVGIRVYARIVSSNKRDFDFDPGDKASIERLCAVCDYLRSGFAGKIHGYIMGENLNTSELLTPAKLEKNAKLASVFTEVLRGGSSNTEIYLPFDENGETDPFAAYAALRYSMAQQGLASAAMLYTCANDPENAISAVSRISSVANSYGYLTDSGALIWKVPSGTEPAAAADTYAALCKAANASGLRFAAFNTDFSAANQDIYAVLKQAVGSERVYSANAEIFNADVENTVLYGAYTIRSFEESYDTTGWIAGGAFKGVMTESSILKDSRALRTQMKGGGNAGMLAYRFDQSVDIGRTDVAFSLGIISYQDDFAKVTVILGCGESRKEYSATVECNKPVELLCTVADDTAAIDYAAVIIHGDRYSDVELYSMALHSSELSDEEMRDKYYDGQARAADPLLYAAIIVVAAGTVVIFSAFAKKKNI